MTAKVQLLAERHCPFVRKSVKPLTSCLPYYQREDDSYVHCVRSGNMHYGSDGKFMHTYLHFWCGQGSSLTKKRRRGRVPGELVAEPSPGRTVCATCEGRAIGSGQHGEGKIGPNTVRYSPHSKFFSAPRASEIEA